MTEDERHARAMAELAQREKEIHDKWGASVFFTPFLASEVKQLQRDKHKELFLHSARRQAIRAANPAPGFKYHHC